MYACKYVHICAPRNYAVTLYFVALLFIVFFNLKIEGLWQPCIKQVYQSLFFQQNLFILCLCVTYWSFSEYFKLFISIIFVLVICDQ